MILFLSVSFLVKASVVPVSLLTLVFIVSPLLLSSSIVVGGVILIILIIVMVAASLIPVLIVVIPSVTISNVLYWSIPVVTPEPFFFVVPVGPSLNMPDRCNLPIQ